MKKESIRNVFGEYLIELGKRHKNLLVVSCDLKSATKTSNFFKKFPNRSFEVGIAEANGLGISAGLALSGYKTLISSFGAFIAGKQLEINRKITYYDISKDDCTLHIILRLRGGMYHETSGKNGSYEKLEYIVFDIEPDIE